MNELHVRRLEPREWINAFRVIAQLRPHLSEETFLAHARRQSHSGYELVGAFRDGLLIGVLGMRPVHTLVRGAHLHIEIPMALGNKIIFVSNVKAKLSPHRGRAPCLLRIAPIDSREQITELGRGDRHRAVSRARPQEAATF